VRQDLATCIEAVEPSSKISSLSGLQRRAACRTGSGQEALLASRALTNSLPSGRTCFDSDAGRGYKRLESCSWL